AIGRWPVHCSVSRSPPVAPPGPRVARGVRRGPCPASRRRGAGALGGGSLWWLKDMSGNGVAFAIMHQQTERVLVQAVLADIRP
ncbi:MAG TPA: hypothetical protein VLQ79_02985, partial [Myxococcaceae bacterium]|nr:hypothetical protein [Myxococcaceae bacterium]